MPKFVASIAHRDTGKTEYLIRDATLEHELRDLLSDEGFVVRSIRPAKFGGKGARFEIRTPKGRVAGPFGADILRAMVRDGQLTPRCFIRKTGDLDTHKWLPAWKAKGLFPGHVANSIRQSGEIIDGNDDLSTNLRRLKKCFDDGLIDKQEYDFKKGELLQTPYKMQTEAATATARQTAAQPPTSTAFLRNAPKIAEKVTPAGAYSPLTVRIIWYTVAGFSVFFMAIMFQDTLIEWTNTPRKAHTDQARTVPSDQQSSIRATVPANTRHQIITLQQDFDQVFQRVSDRVAEDMMRISELRSALLGNEQPDLLLLERLHDIWVSVSSTLRGGKQALEQIDHRIRNKVSNLERPREFDGLRQSRDNSIQQLDRHIATANNEVRSTENTIRHARDMQQVLRQQQASFQQAVTQQFNATDVVSRTTLTSSNIGRHAVPMLALADSRGTVHPRAVFDLAGLDNAFRSTLQPRSTDVQRRWVGDGNMGMVWMYKATLCFEPKLFAFEEGNPALAFPEGINLRAVLLYENTSSDYASLSTDSYLILVQFQMRASPSEASRFVRHVNGGGSIRVDWHFIGSTDDSLTQSRKPDSKIENRAELTAEIESYELVD